MELNRLGADMFDWVKLSDALRERGCRVVSFIPSVSSQGPDVEPFVALMSERTGGAAMRLSSRVGDPVSAFAKNSMGIVVLAMGWEYEFDEDVEHVTLPITHCDRVREGDLLSFSRRMRIGPMKPGAVPVFAAADDVQRPVNVFKKDADFQAVVFAVFDMLTSDRQLALMLTYISIFATYWRAICARRNDARRAAVVDGLSRLMATMPPGDVAKMKAFIEQSYDQTADIEEVCDAARLADPEGPRVFLDVPAADRKTRAELADSTRGCTPAALAALAKMLSGLRMVSDVTSDAGVPVSCDELFSVLPHLMVPGVRFSTRPAAVLATLAILTSSVLADPAKAFLRSVCGTWIDPTSVEVPEQGSFEFVRLMRRLAAVLPDAFTDAEIELLSFKARVGGLKVVGNNTLSDPAPEVGHFSSKTVRPDRKKPCSKCHFLRSTTILVRDAEGVDVCGLCLNASPGYGQRTPDVLGPGRSCFCECGTCGVHYAVVNVENLNVRAKCHACRFHWKAPAPFKACVLCKNRYMHQTLDVGEGEGEGEGYVCPPCEAAGKAVVEAAADSTVSAFLGENGLGVVDLAYPDGAAGFFQPSSLFKTFPKVSRLSAASAASVLTVNKKEVVNDAEVRAELEAMIAGGVAERGVCDVCFSDMAKPLLRPMCGRHGCGSVACVGCLGQWYGVPRPGAVVSLSHLTCPYCKKMPTPRFLAPHNPALLSLKRVDVSRLDPAFHHAWCVACGELKPAAARECEADPPALTAFRCDDCAPTKSEPAAGVDIEYQIAPCCGVAVQKTAGCNHISCACGAHWCWVCQEVTPRSEIYDHLVSAHGRIFPDAVRGDESGDESDGESDDEY